MNISNYIKSYIRDQWVNYKISLIEPQAREDLLAGARLYFYDEGTTNPRNIYQDENCEVVAANPQIASCNGEFNKIFLEECSEHSYDAVLETSSGLILSVCGTRKMEV